MLKNRLQPVWTGFLAVFFGLVRSVGVLGQPATGCGCRSVQIGLKNRTGPDLRTLLPTPPPRHLNNHHHLDGQHMNDNRQQGGGREETVAVKGARDTDMSRAQVYFFLLLSFKFTNNYLQWTTPTKQER